MSLYEVACEVGTITNGLIVKTSRKEKLFISKCWSRPQPDWGLNPNQWCHSSVVY